MRRAVTPAIPPSMYRHFAVITLLLTTALAMFANGENREAQAAQSPRPAARPTPAAAIATRSPTTASQPASAWGFDSDGEGSFGQPMERLISGASSLMPDLDEVVAPGYSPEYLASLSEEERRLLLQGLQDNGMLDAEIQSDRAAALSAASQRRSGSASAGD
jgi:hypothetical protein